MHTITFYAEAWDEAEGEYYLQWEFRPDRETTLSREKVLDLVIKHLRLDPERVLADKRKNEADDARYVVRYDYTDIAYVWASEVLEGNGTWKKVGREL